MGLNEVYHHHHDGFDDFIYKERIGKQTLQMEFLETERTYDTIYFWVRLGVFNKRKHRDSNEDGLRITGENPLATFSIAKQAFKKLEEAVLEQFNHRMRVTICVSWVDNRRKRVYKKVLSKEGYQLSRYDGEEVLMKSWEVEK